MSGDMPAVNMGGVLSSIGHRGNMMSAGGKSFDFSLGVSSDPIEVLNSLAPSTVAKILHLNIEGAGQYVGQLFSTILGSGMFEGLSVKNAISIGLPGPMLFGKAKGGTVQAK
ncbi:MAG: hypothetical protein ACK4M7_10875 [Burkholderiales bacterium]